MKGLLNYMRYSLKLPLLAILLLMSIELTGCINGRRANPPRNQNSKDQNTPMC